tara:strand:+ start:5685 stop:6566 length:882 start_codon:yes stop_codon:yes gene_type:complete
MNYSKVFYNGGRLKLLWRILIFITLLIGLILPLLLIDNSIQQFFGAVLVLLLALYISSKYIDKRDFKVYGIIFKREMFINFLIGITIGIFSVIIILLIGKALGLLSISKLPNQLKISVLFLFVSKMFLVAILEETFFRGYLFTNFYEGIKFDKISKKLAIAIALVFSSFLFGLAHFFNNNASTLSIALLTINGIVWCIPFIISKNLGLSIGMHLAWNFTQTLVGFTMSGNVAKNAIFSIKNEGSVILTGGNYGPEAGILGVMGFVIMLILSLIYLNCINKTNQAFEVKNSKFQ